MKYIKKVSTVLLIVMLSVSAITVQAKTNNLPSGFIIGDAESIFADPVTGEYFVVIENMLPGELYTKNIYLQNTEALSNYKLYLRAEPVSSEGSVDLFDICEVTLSIDGEEFYSGSANGLGNIDMQNNSYELGEFSGESQKTMTLTAFIPGEAMNINDSGEIQFKWIFDAAQKVVPDPPNTGVLAANMMLYIIIGCLSVAILISFILCIIKRRKEALQYA